MYQLATISASISLAGIVFFRLRPAWNQAAISLFMLVWVALAGSRQTSSGIVPRTAQLNGHLYSSPYLGNFDGAWKVFSAFSIGLVAGAILETLAPSHSSRHERGAANLGLSHALATTAVVASLALLAFSLGSSGYPTSREAFNSMLSRAPDGNTLVAEAVIRALVQGLPFAIAILSVATRRVAKYDAVAAYVCLVLWSNPVLEARYWSFGVIASLILVSLASSKKFPTLVNRLILILLPLLTIAIFPALDQFRYEAGAPGPLARSSTSVLVTDADFDAFAQTGNGYLGVEIAGHTMGSQILSPLSTLIPRALWPGKPLDGGQEISRRLGTKHPNIASPLAIELFMDFGYPGALLGAVGCMFLAGRMDRSIGRSGEVSALAAALVPFWLIIMRGSLLQASYRILPFTLTVMFLTRARRDKVARAPSPAGHASLVD